jgi:rhamnose utilization protein RhaD (predicted bifunctional aldolase and dehydrogenase)
LIQSPQLEIKRLREFSARIGRDPLLAQASAGNTSVKLEGVLWIKASGKWLIQAERDEVFVAIDLALIQKCLRQNTKLPASCPTWSGELLPASIETTMHAALPYRIVIHVHSINTIAWSVRKDAPAQLAERLRGLPWQWIPYVPSGLPLAREVETIFSRYSASKIFVLGNHGLVIGGENCDLVEDLLNEVEQRLAIRPRTAPEPDRALLTQITGNSHWQLPEEEAIHALATDTISQRILSGGILYPCQAIFLADSSPITSLSINGQPDQDRYRPFLIVGGSGVLLHKDITRADREMLMGLTQVVQRIEPNAPIRYLTPGELEIVLNQDAYRYRQLAGSNLNCELSMT